MIKNNFYAMLTHVICIFGSFIVSFLFWKFIPLALSFSVCVLVVYFIVGSKLAIQNSRFKNLMSVSFVGIGGILIWVFSHGSGVISWNLKQLFILYIYPSGLVVSMLPNYMKSLMKYEITQVAFSLLPTILFWIGLEWKTSRVKPM